jgi:hypothetical protein
MKGADEWARVLAGAGECPAAGEQYSGCRGAFLHCPEHDRPEVLDVLGYQPAAVRAGGREDLVVADGTQIRPLRDSLPLRDGLVPGAVTDRGDLPEASPGPARARKPRSSLSKAGRSGLLRL